MAYERARGGHATKGARNSQEVREEGGGATGFVGSRPMLTFQHQERRAGDRDLVSSEATVDIVIQSKQVPKVESLRPTIVREVRSQCPEAACKVSVSYLINTLRR